MESKKNFATLAALYANIGKLITGSMEFEHILSGIMTEVRTYFQPQHWSMMRYDPITKKLYFAIVEGKNLSEYEKFRLDLGEGIAGHVAQTKESALVQDAYSDLRFQNKIDKETGFKTDSIIAVPCIHRENLYGVFELVNHENMDRFTEADLSVLQSIADFAAIAFSNAENYQHALLQSKIDPLTGLFNHSKLSELITEVTQNQPHRRKEDDEHEIIVVYMDINNFKEINDTYGHSEGDRILNSFATTLLSTFRKDDTLIRVGGDEFVAIVNHHTMDMTESLTMIEKRMESINLIMGPNGAKAAISYGMVPGDLRDLKDLLNQADEKMYEKKASMKQANNTE